MGAALLPGRVEVLDALASLLVYPGDGFAETVASAEAVLRAGAPRLARAAAPFFRAARDEGVRGLEERYARTFDWSPTACLEVGWHLHGERYERGAFLVEMRARLRAVGVEEGRDLPDHLASVLRWLGRAPDAQARAFAEASLRPALARIRGGLEGLESPWSAVLAAVDEAVAGLSPAAGTGGA